MEETRQHEVARCLFREANDALFIFDPRDHRVVDVNPAAQRLSGFGKKELCRRKVTEVFTAVAPGGILRLIDAYMATGFFHSREGYGLVRADGERPIPINISVSRMHTQPHPLGLAVVRDISERKRAEAALRESEERYRLLFESNPQPMWVVDLASLAFLEVNEAACRRYGYSAAEFAAMSVADLVADPSGTEPIEPEAALPQPGRRVLQRHRRRDGTAIDVELTEHQVLFRGRPSKLVLAQDVTERRRAELALFRQAMHDPLTGLPNRNLLQERMRRCIAGRDGGPPSFALLLLDLDGFKLVNDELGHHCGDLVLREIGQRFRQALRETDTVARFGGDEFAVLLPGADARSAEALASRLVESLRPPFLLEGREHAIGASIGIALYPEHAADPTVLTRRADVAMYAAKRARTGFATYRPGLEDGPPIGAPVG